MFLNMSPCGSTLEEQLSSIMNVIAKAAVSEISQLFSEGSATLRLQITRSLKDNEALRTKMKVMRSELFSLRRQTRSNASRSSTRFTLDRANICKPRTKSLRNENCDDLEDRGAPSDSLHVDAPGSSHMSSHSEELRILSVHGKGEGPFSLEGNDTHFTASELGALSSLSADHSVAKSLERAEQLTLQQRTPDTILIKAEDIEMPAEEDFDDFGDRSKQCNATSDSLHVDTPGSSHMSSHSEDLRILRVHGEGVGPLDGHDTPFTSELEPPNSLSADHSVAKSLEQLVHREELTGQRTPDTILIKEEEDIGGCIPPVAIRLAGDREEAMNMEDFDSDGSDIDVEFKGFESEREDENDFVPVDPLDQAQEGEFLDTEGEEEDDDFRRFQVDWRTSNYQPRTTKTFSRTPGVKQPIPLDASPLDVFSRIFTDQLWDTLLTETNRYAEQVRAQIPTTSKWTPVSKTEMKTFLGLCLCFGILKLPARRDYWRQTKWLYQTNVPRAMSRDRFDMIWRYLHLEDNLDPALDKSDKLWKIRRFMDLLLHQFQALYEVNGFVSVNESMVKYKGRLAFQHYLPMKPVKWGMKVWIMAESNTGYVNNFQVYTGAIAGKTETGLAYRIVSDLAKPYFGSNLCVYMDNFYTSVKLLLDLQVRGVQACGTVRAGRKDLPKSKELTKKAGLNKHQFNVAQQDDLTFCVWQDTKTVMVLSNFHDPTANGSVKRRTSGQRQADVRVPACLADYQQHMKGVDLLDQMVAYYQIRHRSTKWWRRLFFYLISVAGYNAFVAARSVGGPGWKYRKSGYKDWLEDLSQELIVPVTARSAPCVLPTTPTGAFADHDLAQINTKRKTCRECSLKQSGTNVRPGSTMMGCKQCNVPLHRECFMYHVGRETSSTSSSSAVCCTSRT